MTSLVVGWLSRACTLAKRCIRGLYSYYGTLIGTPTPQEFNCTNFDPPGVTPNRAMAPREALFVKLLWPLVMIMNADTFAWQSWKFLWTSTMGRGLKANVDVCGQEGKGVKFWWNCVDVMDAPLAYLALIPANCDWHDLLKSINSAILVAGIFLQNNSRRYKTIYR